jgi:opacity protein-like surface antigen
LIATLPALAQESQFKVGVDYGFMKTKINNPSVVGTMSNFQGPPNNITFPVSAEYGNPNPLGVDLAYRSGNNELALEFMTFNKTRSTGYASVGSLFLTAPENSPFTNQVKLAADTVDLKWNHYFPMKQAGTFSTSLGLRTAHFEDKLTGVGSSDSDMVTTDFKTNGYGLLGGIGYSYPFTNRLSLEGDVNLILFRASNTSTGSDDGQVYGAGSATVKTNNTFGQTDLRVHLDWKLTRALGASVGYRYYNFGKAATTTVPNNWYAVPPAIDQAPTSWRMDGVTLGLSYTF